MSEAVTARLFVAVVPDARTSATLAALPRPVEPGVRWVPPANLHVTLRFLGPAPIEPVADALASVRGVAEACTDGPVGRLGRDALVVPIGGLDDLAAEVAAATAFVGRPAVGFRGHLTLARLKQRAACGLTNRRIELSWRVEEFALFESDLRPDGAMYRVLRRYRLDGTGA